MAAEILERLQGAAVPTVVLGPVGLIAGGYLDAGAREAPGLDLLVPPEAAQVAVETINRSGWRALGRPPNDLPAVQPGWSYIGSDGVRLRLRWRAFTWSGADEGPLWDRARTVAVGGAATRTLATEEQLLYAIAESVAWSHVAPVTWVLDACAVLRSSTGRFDWS